jgi:hypothetical protein
MTPVARILSAVVCLWAAAPWAATPLFAGEKKLPVPSAAAQDAAMTVVKELYAADYAKAKTLADKVSLAKKLLDLGKSTKDDPAGRFVLLRLSRDIATQGLDGLAAFEAVDAISETFEIDPVEMKAAVLKYGAAHATLPQHHKRLMEAGLFFVDVAIAEDNYSLAKQLCDFAAAEATAANESETKALAIQRGEEVEGVLAVLYEKAQNAEAMLKSDPINPQANSAVGEYLCFVKGEWDRGILMLALGNDPGLKAIAEKELDELTPTRPEQLGDAWWERADKEAGPIQRQSRARAAYWYRAALPGLSGLAKSLIEKRLASLAEPRSSSAVAEEPPAADGLPEHARWTLPYSWKEQVQRTRTVIDITPGGGRNERQEPYTETVRHRGTKTVRAKLVKYDFTTGNVVLKSIPDESKGEKEEVRSFRYAALGEEDKRYLDAVKKQLMKQ